MRDETEIVAAFLTVAQLAHLSLGITDVRLESARAPHRRPKRLPKGCQAVYVFFLGDACLKVGKAGPKSTARFGSHHYGLSAPSTLARSLLAHRRQIAALLPTDEAAKVRALTPQGVGRWIEANTDRVNLLLPVTAGPFALSLLEAFIQWRFRPMFEGSSA